MQAHKCWGSPHGKGVDPLIQCMKSSEVSAHLQWEHGRLEHGHALGLSLARVTSRTSSTDRALTMDIG